MNRILVCGSEPPLDCLYYPHQPGPTTSWDGWYRPQISTGRSPTEKKARAIMANARTKKALTKPERVELWDEEQNVIGVIPLKPFLSERGNTWYGVPDPKSGGEKAAHAQYGLTVASKLVGLEAGQLPPVAALFMGDELVEAIELSEGVTGSGNPKHSTVINVDTSEGMRRFTFRISALASQEDTARHNLTASVTRTGGGSGTVESWD